jgi:hypothetical protein
MIEEKVHFRMFDLFFFLLIVFSGDLLDFQQPGLLHSGQSQPYLVALLERAVEVE